jgi:UDP-N-acetylmuramyl pentapeptide phosphotransferase/UDP-N-acetylglucosamine-1-phosphate transferase
VVVVLLTFGIVGGLLAYGCVGWLRRWAKQHQILDIPNERSSHSEPIPRIGGLAIVFVTLVGGAIFTMFDDTQSFKQLRLFWLGGLLVATLGWLDDLYNLPYWQRLVGHAASAAFVIAGIGYLELPYFHALGGPFLRLMGVLIIGMWIVGLINAYNFMDGIDGLAGGLGVIAGLNWVFWGIFTKQYTVAVLGVLLAGANVGFLFHNLSSARIFMGDSGSTFIGYALASIALMGAKDNALLCIIGSLTLWPFIFDTSVTFLRRLCKGENVFIAHRSHLYQRLVIAGYSHRFVTILYMSLALIGGLIGWIWYLQEASYSFSPVVVTLILLLGTGLWCGVRIEEKRKSFVNGKC